MKRVVLVHWHEPECAERAARLCSCGLDQGLVDTKVCAIDAVWSGLRFSRRRT